MNNKQNFSYWEMNQWFNQPDFTIVGAGIVGLFTAIFLKEKFPKSKILILERSALPNGASTKNAGFTCFGSLSELLMDQQHYPMEQIVDLVKERWEGLQIMRATLGDKTIDFQQHGGYELFTAQEENLWSKCFDQLQHINKELYPIFKQTVYHKVSNLPYLKGIEHTLFNPFEGQIDTGKMMHHLIKKAQQLDIQILFGIEVSQFISNGKVTVKLSNEMEFQTQELIITTNAFIKSWLPLEDIQPARAQVLVTKPIENLQIKGTFHMDQGYYYFRNIHHRILLGGGRNLNFEAENTNQFGNTELIMSHLTHLLQHHLLPNQSFEIDQQWSGIMAIGSTKKPIIKQIEPHITIGVRLGGMGVAIGSKVGKKISELF